MCLADEENDLLLEHSRQVLLDLRFPLECRVNHLAGSASLGFVTVSLGQI